MTFRFALPLLALVSPLCAAPLFNVGDTVRLTRGETLLFQGKELASVPKGEEFSVLKHDAIKRVVFVEYYKDDGTLVAVAAPAEAFEAAPANGWTDLLKGVEAFRDQRSEDARRLLARAAQDEQQKQLVAALAPRVNGALMAAAAARTSPAAQPALNAALQGLRDTAAQLVQAGHLCLALPLDEGVDRFAGAPATKLNRDDVAKRVATSNRAIGRARQLVAVHKLFAAKKLIEEGLQAEPSRPELKLLAEHIAKDIEEADGHNKNANRMRQVPKGTIHALTAIEMGLKVCVDHPKLRALKADMQSAFEERTSPPVTAAFLSAAGSGASKEALTEGHKIYTTRCTECHDLELLDSRSISAWRTIVGGMARRAKIDDAQQQRIMYYITVAQRTMDAKGE